jgi:hypothetical protein
MIADPYTNDRLYAIAFQVTKDYCRRVNGGLRGRDKVTQEELLGPVYVELESAVENSRKALSPEAYLRHVGLETCRRYQLYECRQGGQKKHHQEKYAGKKYIDIWGKEDYEGLADHEDQIEAIDLRDELSFYMRALDALHVQALVLTEGMGCHCKEAAQMLCTSWDAVLRARQFSIEEARHALMNSETWFIVYEDVHPGLPQTWVRERLNGFKARKVRKTPLERAVESDVECQHQYDEAMYRCQRRGQIPKMGRPKRRTKSGRPRRLNMKTVDWTMPGRAAREKRQAVVDKIRRMTG